MEVCVRRKQRNRAVRDIRVRLDRDNLSHGEGLSYACALHRRQKGDAEPGDVEGRAVVAVPIEATVWAPEPASPLHRIGSMGWETGAVGPGPPPHGPLLSPYSITTSCFTQTPTHPARSPTPFPP